MAKIFRGWTPFIVAALLLSAIVVAALLHRKHSLRLAPVVLQTRAVSAPAASTTRAAATTQSTKARVVANYLDVIKAQYLTFPATQPLGVPLEFAQAAHLILHDPIYFSGMSRAEMWISRADGPDAAAAIAEATDDNKDIDVHVLRPRVAFVHWMLGQDGKWAPWIVCNKHGGKFEVFSAAKGHQSIPADRDYRWDHAISWDERIIVPSAGGVSIFQFEPTMSESYHGLARTGGMSRAAAMSEPRVMFVRHGTTSRQDVIAWMPWEEAKIGGGAARFSDAATDASTTGGTNGTWTDLATDAGWPARILHLVPMLDGTVLILSIDDKGAAIVAYNTLDRAAVKEQEVSDLVDQLSDPDQKQRNAAYEKLSQYGPGIWPTLERLMPEQGPEAKSRLRQLLKQRVTPTLSGMTLLGSRSLKVASRLSDGGTVFYAEAGVMIPHPETLDADPDYRVPAWIGIRPGDVFRPLPTLLTDDLTPGVSQLQPNGEPHGEVWIVTGDGHGPREFVGNGFVNLLRKSEQRFSEFSGIDRRGRWLFRKPIEAATATAASTLPSSGSVETLIIDPTLPDPTPRLPVWVFNNADVVGWTKEGWPVAKKVSAYILRETDWEAMDEKETMFSRPQDVPAPVEVSANKAATTNPATSTATAPSTRITTTVPATTPSTIEADRPILTDRDGNQYLGGLTDLRVISRSGKRTTWTLPAIGNGTGPAWLVRTADGRLFLFNQPGRVVRIKPTPSAPEPFAIEKIFTHNVPTVEHPTRIWLDPVGRIIMAWENQLAIFFPSGYIPPAIAEKIVSGGNDDDE